MAKKKTMARAKRFIADEVKQNSYELIDDIKILVDEYIEMFMVKYNGIKKELIDKKISRKFPNYTIEVSYNNSDDFIEFFYTLKDEYKVNNTIVASEAIWDLGEKYSNSKNEIADGTSK